MLVSSMRLHPIGIAMPLPASNNRVESVVDIQLMPDDLPPIIGLRMALIVVRPGHPTNTPDPGSSNLQPRLGLIPSIT